MRPPPLADVHISLRPQSPQQAQATTKRPKRRSIASAPATAIRPAEAPSVKSRSRARRHVEGVDDQDGDEQDRQRIDDGGDARRRRAHRVEEPDAGGDGADGHQDLHPRRGPGPGGVREGHAGRRRAPWRRSPSSRRSRRGRRRRRWPRARRPGRRPAAGSNPRAPRAGWPGGPPRRMLTARRHRAGPGTARARRGPALRRSATAPTTGPDASVVPSSDGRAAFEQADDGTRGRPRPPARPRRGPRGSSTVIVTGSAAGCSSSRTIIRPAWAVARQWTRRRLSPGT